MSMVARTVLWFALFLMSACTLPQEKLHPEVADFIRLLVRANEPTVAEYARFGGECGGESELAFALNECRSTGWKINSKSCVAFTRRRCRLAEQAPSLALGWLRERFSTVGKDYQLISVQSKSDDIDLVEVEIGKHTFLLFHNTSPYPPGGLAVGVSKVNGKKIMEYL